MPKNIYFALWRMQGRTLFARQLGAATLFLEGFSQGERARASNARPYNTLF
ncbi:hypothetical protein [Gemmiger formicilis]|jgi:hypothetical protein|uniref:hypothetical protein n=1 Tax=Gemmiger formicilis TaxID=745368 RepID=UPI003AB029F6